MRGSLPTLHCCGGLDVARAAPREKGGGGALHQIRATAGVNSQSHLLTTGEGSGHEGDSRPRPPRPQEPFCEGWGLSSGTRHSRACGLNGPGVKLVGHKQLPTIRDKAPREMVSSGRLGGTTALADSGAPRARLGRGSGELLRGPAEQQRGCRAHTSGLQGPTLPERLPASLSHSSLSYLTPGPTGQHEGRDTV